MLLAVAGFMVYRDFCALPAGKMSPSWRPPLFDLEHDFSAHALNQIKKLMGQTQSPTDAQAARFANETLLGAAPAYHDAENRLCHYPLPRFDLFALTDATSKRVLALTRLSQRKRRALMRHMFGSWFSLTPNARHQATKYYDLDLAWDDAQIDRFVNEKLQDATGFARDEAKVAKRYRLGSDLFVAIVWGGRKRVVSTIRPMSPIEQEVTVAKKFRKWYFLSDAACEQAKAKLVGAKRGLRPVEIKRAVNERLAGAKAVFSDREKNREYYPIAGTRLYAAVIPQDNLVTELTETAPENAKG